MPVESAVPDQERQELPPPTEPLQFLLDRKKKHENPFIGKGGTASGTWKIEAAKWNDHKQMNYDGFAHVQFGQNGRRFSIRSDEMFNEKKAYHPAFLYSYSDLNKDPPVISELSKQWAEQWLNFQSLTNVSKSKSKTPKRFDESVLKRRRGEFGYRCRNCGSWKWLSGDPGASWSHIVACNGNQNLKKQNKEHQGKPYRCLPNRSLAPDERARWAGAERPPRYQTDYANWALANEKQTNLPQLIAVLHEKKIPFREEIINDRRKVQLDNEKLNILQFDIFIDDLKKACPNAKCLERDPSVAEMRHHLTTREK